MSAPTSCVPCTPISFTAPLLSLRTSKRQYRTRPGPDTPSHPGGVNREIKDKIEEKERLRRKGGGLEVVGGIAGSGRDGVDVKEGRNRERNEGRSERDRYSPSSLKSRKDHDNNRDGHSERRGGGDRDGRRNGDQGNGSRDKERDGTDRHGEHVRGSSSSGGSDPWRHDRGGDRYRDGGDSDRDRHGSAFSSKRSRSPGSSSRTGNRNRGQSPDSRRRRTRNRWEDAITPR